MNLLNTEDKPVTLSLHGICYGINNLLSSKCDNHNTIITPNHINSLHNITNPPNLSARFYEDFLLHEKN